MSPTRFYFLGRARRYRGLKRFIRPRYAAVEFNFHDGHDGMPDMTRPSAVDGDITYFSHDGTIGTSIFGTFRIDPATGSIAFEGEDGAAAFAGEFRDGNLVIVGRLDVATEYLGPLWGRIRLQRELEE